MRSSISISTFSKQILCSQRSHPPLRSHPPERQNYVTRRRWIQSSFLLTPFLVKTAFAETTEPVTLFTDPEAGFTLSYPSDWTTAEATSSGNEYIAERTLVWFPKDVPVRDVNVTLLINNAAADFTSLGSFGSPQDFGSNVVNSMDRSYVRRGYLRAQEKNQDIQTAKLIEAKSVRGMYDIEYLLKTPGQEQKRLISLIALRFDGKYNRLYTLTAQCVENIFPKYEKEIRTILDSFEPPKAR